MKSLVIVEDEPYMADFLINYIDWGRISIRVEGVADNGRDGLELIRKFRPDIVITDIKMPGTDGLTMIKSMKRDGIGSKIVILSSHSEFHMVKEAFTLGVSDYILKTELDEETLTRVMVKLINSISFGEKNSVTAKDLQYKRDKVKAFVFGTEKMSECNLRLRICEKGLSAAVIRLLDYEAVLKAEWNMESELLRYGLMNVLEELLDNESSGEIFQTKNDELVMLISDTDEKNSDEKTAAAVQRVCKSIESVFGFATCAGFSGFTNSSQELKGLFKSASLAADFTFVYGRSEPLSYGRIRTRLAEPGKINTNEAIAVFSSALERYDFDAAARAAEEYMRGEPFGGRLDDLYEFCDMLCLEISRLQKQLLFDKTIRSGYKKIIRTGTLDELRGYIKEELQRLSEEANENVALVPRVKRYIDENYFKKISLESIADSFGVGYQKLSREFKKKTGKSLKKYLTEIRMNEAMRLIESSEYMLYEIAEMVGYANYENFSRMFYNYFKKWPKEIERP